MPVDPAFSSIGNVDYLGNFYGGQQAARANTQQQQAFSALQGLDLNSQDSVSSAINQLAKAGAGDQANALMSLQFNRSVNQAMLARVQDAASRQQPSALPQQPVPQAPAAAAPAAAAPAAAAPAAAAPDPFKLLSDLKSQPANQRQAYFANVIAPAISQHGTPDQIETERKQLADMSDGAIDAYTANLQQHAAGQPSAPPPAAPAAAAVAPVAAPATTYNQTKVAATDSAPAGAPAAPRPITAEPNANNYSNQQDFVSDQIKWAQGILSDQWNTDPLLVGLQKSRGIDVEPAVQRAYAALQPFINKRADLQNAQPIAEATERGTQLGKPSIDVPLLQDVPGVGHAGATLRLSPDQAFMLYQTAKPGMLGTLSPQDQAYLTDMAKAEVEKKTGGQIALNKAFGTSRGNVLGGLNAVPGQGGTTTTYLGTPGPNGTVVGQTTPTPELNAQTADFGALTKMVTTNAQNDSINSHRAGLQDGNRLINLVESAPGGKYKENLGDLSSTFAFLGPNAQKYATNSDLLKQDLAGYLGSQIKNTPNLKNQREFDALSRAAAGMKSQDDTIKLAGALKVAKERWEGQHDEFMQNYLNDPKTVHSLSAATAAWNNHVDGRTYLSDPVFDRVKINGAPARQIWTPKGK